MEPTLITELLADLCTQTDRPAPEREEVRVWSTSGVERVAFPDETTAIFKYAKTPFHREDQALRTARSRGIPVPKLYASAVREGWLAMLLEDLGTSTRSPVTS